MTDTNAKPTEPATESATKPATELEWHPIFGYKTNEEIHAARLAGVHPLLVATYTPPPPPPPKTHVTFVIERTEFIDCNFDREDFDSFFQGAYDDPDTTPADKAKLKVRAALVWQQLIKRKSAISFKDERPMLRQVEQHYGIEWLAEYPGDVLKKTLLKTYKGLGEIMTRLGHDDD